MHLILLKIWVYFHSSLFRKPVRHPWVLGWPSNGLIFPWQAHSWLWDCAWNELLCVTCRGEYDINGSHLAVFSEDAAFARHFKAPCPPYRNTSGVCYASKNYPKWQTIQLGASSICSIGIINWVFQNCILSIYNCTYKTPFHKFNHIYN